MLSPTAQSPLQAPGSVTLWDAWFTAGMEQLERADGLRFAEKDPLLAERTEQEIRRLYREARDLFQQAIPEAAGLPDEPFRLCLSKAGYAWAAYWLADDIQSCQCAAEALGCLAKLSESAALAGHSPLALSRARCHLILGVQTLRKNELDIASAHFRDSLNAFAQIARSNPDVSFLHERLGGIAASQNHLREAVARYRQAEAILRRLGSYRPQRAYLLAKLADMLVADGQYRQVETAYALWKTLSPLDDLKACSLPAGERPKVGREALIFVRAFLIRGDLTTARDCLKIAFQALDGLPDVKPTLLAVWKMQETDALRMEGHLAEAIATAPCLDEITLDSPLLLVRSHLIRGELWADSGDYGRAQVHLECAEKFLKDVKAEKHAEEARLILAFSQQASGRVWVEDATKRAKDAIHLLEKSERFTQPQAAFALLRCSQSLFSELRVTEALPLAHRVNLLLASTASASHPLRISALRLLADLSGVFHRIGKEDQPGSGFSYCRQAEELLALSHPCRWYDQARLRTTRGQLLHIGGRLCEAQAALSCALELWVWGERLACREHPEKGWTMLFLAALYQRQGHPLEADELYRAFLILAAQIPLSRQLVAFELNRLGNLYCLYRLWAEAGWFYLHAEKIYAVELGIDHEYTKQVQDNLQDIAKELSHSDNAP